MKNIQYALLFLMIMTLTNTMLSAQQAGQGRLCGIVRFEDPQEVAIGANVIAYQEGVYVSGCSTDFNGQYCLNLDPGEYKLEVSYIGMSTIETKIIIIEADKSNTFDVKLEEPFSPDLWLCSCCFYYTPLMDIDDAGVTPIHQSDIELQPVKEVRDLMVNFPGVSVGN